MKKHYFYSHLVEIESLVLELDKMDFSEEEKIHLASLIDSSLHHTVLDAVLSQLQDDDKKVFLKHLKKEDHSKIWQHLNEKIDNIEEKIRQAAERLKEDLHKDIKEAHRIRKRK
ncbi:hypothetical protein HYS97_00515 [Candidatus Daviesbacteria bacterium]|nr:hypothetical protein [Candidatus Daviesbacteria bacterium]